jgi:predicted O-methyltransferase YrrM
VLDGNDNDPTTQGVRELTRILTTGPDWVSSVIPIRDGMLVAFRC